ncbi:hypothetical protein JTB14_010107 [Gonioctena quinquepunctata]|nr:hypothetical protein JTB14_010107 [Gonioctena quinquepunctata]
MPRDVIEDPTESKFSPARYCENTHFNGLAEDVSSLKDFVLDDVSAIKGVRCSQVIRLGRFSTDKSRPAKLTLPNKLDVPVLIKNSKHLKSTEKYKGIYIRPDQTYN